MVNFDGQNKKHPTCLVLSNYDEFTIMVQLFLAFFALASLFVKRQLENPRRDIKTWFLDISKQGFGACYLHVWNMAFAMYFGAHSRLHDQCAWYALNYMIDSTIGLLLTFWFLGMLTKIANKNGWEELAHSGVYRGEKAVRIWLFQFTAWLIILSLVRVVEFILMWLTQDFLASLGEPLARVFQYNIRVELLFVMIMFPGVLNVVYFLIIDNFLKADEDTLAALEAGEVIINKNDQSNDDSGQLAPQQGESSSPMLKTPLLSK